MEKTILQDNINSSNLDNYLIQKKIEVMMDINNNRINNELKKIGDMIYKLNEEICEIKKHFNLNTPENEGDKKPRYGGYNPEDVKIDKFFYFGNKKIKN